MQISILCKVVDNFGDIGVVYRLAKQLKKINESFRSTNNKEDDTKTVLNKKKTQTVSKKSPFNSPEFKSYEEINYITTTP